MTPTWRELAEEKRRNEDYLIDRYRERLFSEGPAVDETDDADRVIDTPRGVGHRFHRGLYATAFSRRSAWPETQLVMELFWQAYADRRFVVMKAIWPPDRIHDFAPPYNDLFYVNLWESIMTRAPEWLAVQPGPVVYLIWSSPVDFDNPPAPGDPPAELLSARSEVDQLKRQWLRSS